MKKYTIFILSFSIVTMAFVKDRPGPLSIKETINVDTMPDICRVLPGQDIEALHPFTNPLSKSFPDPNNYETYFGCQYQFFSNNDKPQLAVRMIRWSSKQEGLDEYKMQVQRHFETWGISPERLMIGADSAYFVIEPMDTSKCDECGLVALQGLYSVYISFKGQYEKVPREAKKLVALQILRMMYDRIPGLAPSRIRNRQ
jgi:hypothetical protein